MNPQPIETARDADLRLSLPAMRRAAEGAWELARRTGTMIIVSRHGVLQSIDPSNPVTSQAESVHEPSPSFEVRR